MEVEVEAESGLARDLEDSGVGSSAVWLETSGVEGSQSGGEISKLKLFPKVLQATVVTSGMGLNETLQLDAFS